MSASPKKNVPIVLLYDNVSLFLVLFNYFHIYKLTQVICSLCIFTRKLISTIYFSNF